MNIRLNCRKAYERLKGGFKIRAASKRVKIYFPNGTHVNVYGKSLSMATLVTILCNGNEHIPPRPFLTDAPRQLRHEFIRILKDHTDVMLRNARNANDLGEIYMHFDADDVAMKVTALIKQWLFDGSYYRARVPNAPKTIRNKGSDVPLVETGTLVNSLSAKIEE